MSDGDNMKKNPKVSIIIPIYNGANYMREAIDSALNQTYNNIEIIVVNDGSSDNTEEIALSYGKSIKYYKKENGGVSTALNLALTKMTGDFFSWLSHDDVYLPEKIETQINYLTNNYGFDSNTILYSNYFIIDEKSIIKYEKVLNNDELIKKPEYSLLRNAINGITLLIPKKAFDECGNFSIDLKCTQDYELWFRMMDKYNFIHIPYTLAKTRVHSGQETNTNPKVITEGNPLWIKMMDSVPDKRKKLLEGSVYNYYYEMACFLGKTPYIESLKYCIEKLHKLDPNINITLSDFILKNDNKSSLLGIIKKLFISLKQLGLKKTIEKTKRFFMNRRLYK